MFSRVYIEITNICNLHCSFCHKHSRKPGQMNTEAFAHILEQLAGKTEYLYYHLMGEPLIHPQLPAFLELASQRGFHSMITTNGTLLKERGEALLRAGVHKVNISLHSFEKDDPQSHLQYLQDVADFARAAADLGTIISLRLWNKGHDPEHNRAVLAFLRDAFPSPWTENSRGYRIQNKLFLEWGDRFQWPDSNAPLQQERMFCYGLRDHFGILCDGTVVPCCLDSDGIIHLGNIFETPLSQILSSQRATAMVQGFSCRRATESLCRRCGYAQRFQAR